jgi:hypothetical protein
MDIIQGMKQDSLHTFIQDRKYIFWYVSRIEQLSKDAILEWIIRYGDWGDLREIYRLLGKDEFMAIYRNITRKKRINLDKVEVNFIDKFIATNA